MPATAIQKNAFFQCRCTNGENLCWNFLPGACVSVSLGLMLCGTPSLPLRSALPVAALWRGRRFRFSVPVPILVFFTKVDEVPFLTKVDDVLFLTKVDDVPLVTFLALPIGLWMRGCVLRTDGALRTVTARR